MNTQYILKVNSKVFVVTDLNDEVKLTMDYTKATRFNTIGATMSVAANINTMIGAAKTRVETMYNTSVSSNL